jgi:hypothetical protein
MRYVCTAEISPNAILDWQRWVDGRADPRTAEWAIWRLLLTGRPQPRPQRWMRGVRRTRDTEFVYSADYPRVCVVVREGVAVAVVTPGSRGGSAAMAPSRRPQRPKAPLAARGGREEAFQRRLRRTHIDRRRRPHDRRHAY